MELPPPDARPPVPEDSVAAAPRPWLPLALILIAIAAIHANVLGFEFVYDDHNQIVSNPTIQSWSYLPHVFTGHVWSHKTSTVLYYRPVFLLWLMANYSIFGLSAAGWHFSTLALHLACAALVYWLARTLRQTEFVSLGAALLFGVYPAHVEAVDWISGVTEPLLAVLFVPSFVLYLRARDPQAAGRAGWRGISLGLFALALLAKETAIAMPAIVFCYEWIFDAGSGSSGRGAKWKRAAAAAAPYALLVVLYLGARTLALGTFAHRAQSHGAAEILYTWPAVIAFYIRHSLIPAGLSVFYNFGYVTRPGLRTFALPVVEILAAAAALYSFSRRSPAARFLAAWMACLFLPLLNLTIFGNGELVHDRYLYAPSIALCILLAMAASKIPSRAAALTAIATLSCAYAFGTVYEGRFWKNGVTLNQRGLAMAPGNATATHNLGVALLERGRRAEAIPYLLAVLARQPNSEETLFALGLCYFDLDSVPEAEKYFIRATAADPRDPKARLFLGVVRAKQSRWSEAETEIRRAIALQRVPTGFKRYHLALGAVLAEKGDLAGARDEYRRELENDPDSEEARGGLNNAEQQLRLGGAPPAPTGR